MGARGGTVEHNDNDGPRWYVLLVPMEPELRQGGDQVTAR